VLTYYHSQRAEQRCLKTERKDHQSLRSQSVERKDLHHQHHRSSKARSTSRQTHSGELEAQEDQAENCHQA
jgi:hypothetical protein